MTSTEGGSISSSTRFRSDHLACLCPWVPRCVSMGRRYRCIEMRLESDSHVGLLFALYSVGVFVFFRVLVIILIEIVVLVVRFLSHLVVGAELPFSPCSGDQVVSPWPRSPRSSLGSCRGTFGFVSLLFLRIERARTEPLLRRCQHAGHRYRMRQLPISAISVESLQSLSTMPPTIHVAFVTDETIRGQRQRLFL